KTTAMGIGPASQKGFIGDPGVQMTPLTVLDPSAASSFTLRNLPGDVAIEYVADVEDGNVIVVTQPADAYTYDHFRAFFGPPAALGERRVSNVTRARRGGTDMTFTVAGTRFNAHFAFELMPAPDGGIISHPGPGTLDEGGKSVGFTQRWP